MTSKRVVVIGGGHNGLTAAAWLAKRGREVVLLEARDLLGGLAAGESFGDGYAHAGILHDTRGLREMVVRDLDLQRHGLTLSAAPERIWAPSATGEHLWIEGEELSGSVSEADRERYAGYRAFLGRVSPVIRQALSQPPPQPFGSVWPLLRTAIGVRRLGAVDMTELLRVLPMCVADWMRDLFENERLSAALALPAVEACFAGPWSAGTAANLVLREACAGPRVMGGPAALTRALVKAAEAHGVSLRRGARVATIERSGGRVVGVQLADGERIDAGDVIATCDPKQAFLSLIGEADLGIGLSEDVHKFRTRGTTAKLHLGLSGPLELGSGEAVTRMHTGESLDDIERAFDAVKYGEMAVRPVLDVWVPSVDDPKLCPDGHAVVSALVHFASPGLSGDALRTTLADRAVAELSRFCPSLKPRIVARELLLPSDLQARFQLSGGHLYHGEHAPDQWLFMRPTVECAHYRTPIDGLWLGGSGCHPGGGITGAPGLLAARALLG
jgi:phytoene dehydrogenase-like protein